MTLEETVGRFDLLYPNALALPEKVAMLSRLEGRLNAELLPRYGENDPAFAGYDAAADRHRRLMIPFPFDDIYIKFLVAENDLVNGDTERYRNSAAVFNAAWDMLGAYYARTRTPPAAPRLRAD